MKNITKYLSVFSLDIIFTVLSILVLYYTRIQTKLYMDQITALSPVLNDFTQQAANNNITSVPLQEVIKLESLLNKALILNDWILPLVILILFIITQAIIWRIINKTPIWKSTIFIIIPSIVFLITITSFTNILFGIMSGESYSLILFIILLILTIGLSYISLILLVNHKKPKDVLKIIKKRYKKSILPFILMIITSLVYITAFTLTLIVAVGEYLGIIIILAMIISIILFELTRYYFLRRLK